MNLNLLVSPRKPTILWCLLLQLSIFQSIALVHAEALGKPQHLTSPGQTPQGLAKSDWASIRAAHNSWEHNFMPVEGGGFQARSKAQQWTAAFDGVGFTAKPKAADWKWGLELRSYGFGKQQHSVQGKSPVLSAQGQRLSSQWGAGLEEWFINDERGLEHGFTLARRPEGAAPGLALEVVLATRGTLRASVAADAQTVYFRDAAGAPVVNYAGLKAWDADGKVLPSRFVPSAGGGIALLVEETAARYPITIDPIAQQAYLKPDQINTFDNFGTAVAVSGDTVVVGAPLEDSSTMGINSTPNEGASDAGAAYVFVRSGGVWTQQAYLKSSQVNMLDYFGRAVAVSGDTVVVGAEGEDSSLPGINRTPNEVASLSGAVYVFVRSAGVWTQQAYLKSSQVTAGDAFGMSVAASGDTVVVGANAEDSSSTGINSTPNESANAAGAAYVFVRSGTTWSQQAYLKPAVSPNQGDDSFGYSVAVSGDTVVVGAFMDDSSTTGINSTPNESATSAGAAYVFVRSGTTWSQEAYLKASQVNGNDNFGNSVAVSGDTVVVGSKGEDSSTTGINSTPNESASAAGAAYVFVRSGTTWSQQAYLKASQVTASDNFGQSVAVDLNTVVVGAVIEGSSTTGINSTPDEGASGAGAAYVFVRGGTTWTQQAYLKASQVTGSDYFGISVAVSGDTVVVGAMNEDSSTTGINSTPNEDASGAGAAYIFTGLGPTPDIEVLGKGTVIATGDTSPAGADDTDFGNVAVLNGIATHSFTIANSGLATLNLTGSPLVEISGPAADDFAVTSEPTNTVSFGDETTFEITFAPILPGPRTATVTITNSDNNKASYTFVIAGYGTAVKLEPQAIKFAPPATVSLVQSPLALTATASSGLPVSLVVVSGPATLSGNSLTLTGAGTVKITATQLGNGEYAPAKAVTKSITVKADPTTLTLLNLLQTYDGNPKPIATLGASSPVITYKIAGVEGSTAPTAAGSYPVKAVAGSVTKTGTLIIAKAVLTITPENKQRFLGSPNPPLTYTVSGLLGSDTTAVITKVPVLSTTATVGSPLGIYPIKASGAAALNYTFNYQIGALVVDSFAGNYEALLVDGSSLPVGKLAITVPTGGKTFTGKLFTATETAAVGLKGTLTTDPITPLASGSCTVTKNAIPYVVSFTLPPYGDVQATVTRSGAALGSANDGRKLLKLPRGVKVSYSGAHSIVLEPATPAGSGVPTGAGWATAKIATTGSMAVAGKLGDGTPFTASLPADVDPRPGYRLWVQPYLAARTQAYLGGRFTLAAHPGLANRRYVAAASLTWKKDGLPADATFRAGFPRVTSVMVLDPWLPPQKASATLPNIPLSTRLGLTGGVINVSHSNTGSAADGNLPSVLALSAINSISVTTPAANATLTKWKVTKLDTATGKVEGSFELLDGLLKRTATFSGILRQPASSADSVIGDGHYMVAPLAGTEKLTGEVLFQRTPPVP
ncbi:MAG: choice-of-anchor D domain-containing protein [Verrucomicrobiaceae bacterium]|nr:choice-of-anchor D domain-containing protein [Verrucomicrobiaceae bacterium]